VSTNSSGRQARRLPLSHGIGFFTGFAKAFGR
jgi:hypothetical protein